MRPPARPHSISIHALHEESDWAGAKRKAGMPFQSTLSMRRATRTYDVEYLDGTVFQSTLSMRRATLRGHVDRVVQPISIHALHEESDLT